MTRKVKLLFCSDRCATTYATEMAKFPAYRDPMGKAYNDVGSCAFCVGPLPDVTPAMVANADQADAYLRDQRR